MRKIIFLVICLVCFPVLARADWDATLRSAFPSATIMTFDNYNDWGQGIQVMAPGEFTSPLPTATSGPEDVDGFFQNSVNGFTSQPIINTGNAIQAFSGGWKGKQARTCYDSTGVCPHGMAMQTYHNANQGLIDQYFFAMVKIPLSSIPHSTTVSYPHIVGTYPDTYWYEFSAWKLLDFGMGFSAPGSWAGGAGAPNSCGPWNVNTYGLNTAIFNLAGYSPYSMRTFQLMYLTAWPDCSAEHNTRSDDIPHATFTRASVVGGDTVIFDGTDSSNNPDIGKYIVSGDWFGLEIRLNRGTVDVANGVVELWVYDKTGTVQYHGKAENFVGMRSCACSGTTYMNNGTYDKWNMFTTGTNRLLGTDPGYMDCVDSNGSCSCGTCLPGYNQFKEANVTTDDWYMDDVIITGDSAVAGCTPSDSGGCIGPTYFSLLGSGGGASSSGSIIGGGTIGGGRWQ